MSFGNWPKSSGKNWARGTCSAGGGEFIVLTDTGEAESFLLAERLRKVVEEHDFGIAGRVTASFGLSLNRPGDTGESVVSRSDERLYLAKQAGRNRVVGRTMASGDH